MLTTALSLQQPLAAYNGAAIARPDLSPIEEHLDPERGGPHRESMPIGQAWRERLAVQRTAMASDRS